MNYFLNPWNPCICHTVSKSFRRVWWAVCMGRSQLTLPSVLVQGEMCALPETFAHLTQLLMPLAAGKMCVVLEVSYHFHFKSFFKADPSIFYRSVISCFSDFIHSFREGITWLLSPNRSARPSRAFWEIRSLSCQGSQALVRGEYSCQSWGKCFWLVERFAWVKVHC